MNIKKARKKNTATTEWLKKEREREYEELNRRRCLIEIIKENLKGEKNE